jgi:hypothetical protein
MHLCRIPVEAPKTVAIPIAISDDHIYPTTCLSAPMVLIP